MSILLQRRARVIILPSPWSAWLDNHTELERPDVAEGQCFEASLELLMLIPPLAGVELWYGHDPVDCAEPAFSEHVFLVWRGAAIDVTARQFWPDTPWPLVEPLAVYIRRFAASGRHEDEAAYRAEFVFGVVEEGFV